MARQVATPCGQPHQVIRVGEEFLARFPTYAERTVYLTDGCADVSRSPDLYVNEAARQIAPVRMTGNYGGEVLRRVRAFKPVDAVARPVLGGVSLLASAGRGNVRRAPAQPPTVVCRLPAGPLASLRAAGAGTDPALVALALPGQ